MFTKSEFIKIIFLKVTKLIRSIIKNHCDGFITVKSFNVIILLVLLHFNFFPYS